MTAEHESTLPPPPGASASPSTTRNALERLRRRAAGVHASQTGWRWAWRVGWWLLLLPAAVGCWGCSLRSNVGRSAALAGAGLLGLGWVGALASSPEDPANGEPAEVAAEAFVETTTTAAPDDANSTTTSSSPDSDAVVDEPASSTSTTTTGSIITGPAPSPNDSSGTAALIQAEAAVQNGPAEVRAASQSLLDDLALLVAAPDATVPRYDRDSFNERADLDGDCIDTRHEVLQAEALSYQMSVNGCSVTVGEWYDPFTGRSTADPQDLQMDHVVALSDAWDSGAWAWSSEAKTEFSNQLANLNVIWGSENQRKANHGPARYSPTNAEQVCAYLVQYASVKIAWGLTVTPEDFDAIEQGLASCTSLGQPDAVTATTTAPSTTIAIQPVAPATTAAPTTTVPPTTTTSAAPVTTAAPTTTAAADCHPAYSPCLPNLPGNAINCGDLPSSLKPVRVLTPGVDPYALDGDDDGVGCEGG